MNQVNFGAGISIVPKKIGSAINKKQVLMNLSNKKLEHQVKSGTINVDVPDKSLDATLKFLKNLGIQNKAILVN